MDTQVISGGQGQVPDQAPSTPPAQTDTTVAPQPQSQQGDYSQAFSKINWDNVSASLTPQDDGSQRPQRGKVAQFFSDLWETAKSAGRAVAGVAAAGSGHPEALANPETLSAVQALGRGVVKTATQTAETALEVGQHVFNPGASVLRDVAAQQAKQGDQNAAALVASIDKPVDQIQSIEDSIVHSAALGGDTPVSAGDKGLEGLTQFTAGMLTYGRYIKFAGSFATRLAGLSAQAGAVGAISVNPSDPARLTNQLASVPWVGQQAVQFMSYHEDGDQLGERIKGGVESAITNLPLTAGMEGLVSGFGWIMSARKAAQTALLTRAARSAQLNTDLGIQAAKVDVAAAEAVAARVHPDDVVDVVQKAEGGYAVVPTSHFADGKVPLAVEEATLPKDALHYANESEADAMAGAINTARKNSLIDPGDVVASEAAVSRGINPLSPADIQKQIATEAPSGVGNAPVNPEIASTIIDESLARMSPEARSEWVARHINMNYFQTDDGVAQIITKLSNAFSDLPKQSDQQLRAAAQDISNTLGTRPEDVLNYAESIAGRDIDKLPATQLALRSFLLAHAEKVGQLARVADMFPDNAVAQANLSQSLETAMRLYKRVSLNATQLGRGLRQQGISVGEGANVEMTTLRDQGTIDVASLAPEQRQALARMLALTGDPEGMMQGLLMPKAIARAAAPRSLNPLVRAYQVSRDWATSWFMESILSGPPTHFVNAVSNAGMAFLRPAEFYFSGLAPGQAAALRRQAGADLFTGLWTELYDSARMAGKAFEEGSPVLIPNQSRTASVATGRFGASTNFSSLPDWANRGLGWLNTLFHTPSRMLTTADEFFSQLNYRAKLRADILAQARLDGVTDPAEMATRLRTQQAFGFNSQGMGIYDRAKAYTEYLTFKGQLDPSNGLIENLGSHLQAMVADHPELRFIIPFVRTPTKIFEVGLEHTPVLGFAMKSLREDFAAGGDRRAVALAQQAFGATLLTGAWLGAKSGVITGRGPSNPVLNQAWRQIDNREPYTLNTPIGRVAIRRLGPPFQILGQVADLVNMSGELSQEDNKNAFGVLLAALTANAMSQTYARGPVDFLDALTSGDPNKWSRLVQNNYVAPIVPNVVRLGNPDRVQRETNNGTNGPATISNEVDKLLNSIAAGVPGWSETLEPRRNLFGEEILKGPGYLQHFLNPFTVSSVPKSPQVAQAMVDLGKALGSMPNKVQQGVDWSDRSLWTKDARNGTPGQSPYDRWLELLNQPVNGRTTRQEMVDFITSRPFAGMEDGIRIGRATAIVQRRLAFARSQVLGEYPALRDATKAARQQQRQQFQQSTPMSPDVSQSSSLLTP